MANQLRDFDGKVAIVTGAGSGIGEASAREIAGRGGSVLVADFNQAAVEAMVQFAVESFGGLDVAVNNAGIGGPLAPTGEYPLDGGAR
jgi:NAD(P)-dependent dehydrogenase (short-subunit alcohol dehydrogenase family)